MTYFVPFEGSALSEAALRRARDLAAPTDNDLIAFLVVPRGNAQWARKRWLDAGEAYDGSTVVERAREHVASIAPEAEFDHAFVGKHEVSGGVASRIRRRAREAGAEVVFLGSENAGHVVTSVSDVGPTVAADDAYDVYIARHPEQRR